MGRFYVAALLLAFVCLVNGHMDSGDILRGVSAHIFERNEDQRIVGERGDLDERHSLRIRLSLSEPAAVEVQNISAKKINFTVNFPAPNGTLNGMVFVFLESGNITIGNETFEVKRGSIAFSIEILDWKFCNGSSVPCQGRSPNQNGTILDFTIALSRIRHRRRSLFRFLKERLCRFRPHLSICKSTCESRLVLPDQINVDGDMQPLPDMFPRCRRVCRTIRRRGRWVREICTKFITIRFPLFDSVVSYGL